MRGRGGGKGKGEREVRRKGGEEKGGLKGPRMIPDFVEDVELWELGEFSSSGYKKSRPEAP